MNTIADVVTGDKAKTGSSLISTQAPVITTTEFRKIVEGTGPSIASSSHRCRGNWAHLPKGPATKAKPISAAAFGSTVAVSAQVANSEKFQVPAKGYRANTPINRIKSPTRFVSKASLAPVTTKD